MNEREQAAILSLCFIAAFANDDKGEATRAQIRRVAEQLSPVGTLHLSVVYQEVLRKKISLNDTLAPLHRPEHKQLAYEAAVCVCDVDGVHSDAEHGFLENLRLALGLDVRAARAFERAAGAISDAGMQPEPVRGFSAATLPADSIALEEMIVDCSLLDAALLLQASTLAAMATIPVQMKLIYRVGKAYGAELNRGEIKHLLSAAGVGPLAQYIELFGLRLRGAAERAARLSFINTYALASCTKQYCSGDAQMDAQAFCVAFEAAVARARPIANQYEAQFAGRLRFLDEDSLIALVRQH